MVSTENLCSLVIPIAGDRPLEPQQTDNLIQCGQETVPSQEPCEPESCDWRVSFPSLSLLTTTALYQRYLTRALDQADTARVTLHTDIITLLKGDTQVDVDNIYSYKIVCLPSLPKPLAITLIFCHCKSQILYLANQEPGVTP